MTHGEPGLLLPAGTRLLHIGPHKTGTTTVQFAFHTRRREVAAQGVHYAGRNSQPMYAVYAVLGQGPAYVPRPKKRRWRELVREIRESAAGRVVISSEGFSVADEAAVRRVVTDLERERLHVVVTLRPLSSILPSQWQQSVQGGSATAYDAWLEEVFDRPDSPNARGFWHRHRHDDLVARWAAEVGPEQMSVVIADERDHRAVLRVFEQLVGLRDGTLVPPTLRTNRSMTWPEIELIRVINAEAAGAGLDARLRHRVVDRGAIEIMLRRPPAEDERRIETPAWALERAAGIGREIASAIAASGLRAIGDLEALAKAAPAQADRAAGQPGMAGRAAGVWPAVVAGGSLGVMLASGSAGPGRRTASDVEWPDAGPLDHREPAAMAWLSAGRDGSSRALADVSTAQLRRSLVARLRVATRSRAPVLAAVARRLRRLRPRRVRR